MREIAPNNQLFSSELWIPALETYGKAAQLTIKLFAADSRPISRPVHATPMFQLFEETTGYDPGIFVECARRCLAQTAARPPIIVSEFCGLAVIGTSLVLDGAIVGAAVGGYAFLDFCQISEVQRLAQDSGIDFERLWRVVREQQPVSKQRLIINAELLQVLGDAILRENRRTRQYGAALSESESQLRALTGRLLTSQEDERRRLARELHDDLIQRLAAFQNQVVRLRLGVQARVSQQEQQQLEEIENQLGKMADDMRNLSHGLHPTILDDLGLEVALQQLVSNFAERSTETARFKVDNVPAAISPAIVTTLYRVAQEALNNVRKHAPNAPVAVTLSGFPTELRLIIEDYGPGFDTKQRTQGLGLISMRERANVVGGQVIITGGPGRGTQIEVIIPLCGSLS